MTNAAADMIFQMSDEHIMDTYGRFPIVLKEGKGSVIYDCDGKKYIDFTSGIGVNCLGIANDGWIQAVTEQLKSIQHISNYYYSEPTAKLAKKLTEKTKMTKVFFSNSGAEANEGAIKLARKYSFDKYGKDSGRNIILTLKQSFHGRTMATLTATGQESFHNYFYPFLEGFRYVEINNIDDLQTEIDKKDVCALIVEPIQGESGVNLVDAKYMKNAKKICDENDILLIFDEVQTGTGRTGKMCCGEYFDITPDIVTLAKGLGGGLPIGAFLCNEKLQSTLSKGMHGSTFGGNPAVCTGAEYILDVVSEKNFLSDVRKKGEYIKAEIAGWKQNCDIIKGIRGHGLMIGIEIEGEPKEYAKKALEAGLLVLVAGTNVIRFLPPLNISREEIDEGLNILKTVFYSHQK